MDYQALSKALHLGHDRDVVAVFREWSTDELVIVSLDPTGMPVDYDLVASRGPDGHYPLDYDWICVSVREDLKGTKGVYLMPVRMYTVKDPWAALGFRKRVITRLFKKGILRGIIRDLYGDFVQGILSGEIPTPKPSDFVKPVVDAVPTVAGEPIISVASTGSATA